ncbi:MAG: hydantoinase/oxoprolinase family protein [Gammaproteobacteria bacterium]|nr:hydantoinase/oxoprolinase family protein [Gammaproteobacteria bacterium]
MIRLGVDTGGTFTDFVLLDADGQLRVHKVLSTPDAPERAILEGIEQLGLDPAGLQLVHGSTVATNAVLEGKGARTVYIGNRGFADLLLIGRQQRAELYSLQPQPLAPPVAPDLCLETGGRLDASGRLVEPLADDDLAAIQHAVARLKPEAVAVNLLFSYLDPALEQRIAAVLPDDVFVSLSSQVLPEIREYERGMATWLNAWVGPRVGRYLERLQRGMAGAPVSVMQSSGDTVAAEQAAGHAVRMLLSGPAGGLIAAAYVADTANCGPLLTFDMGGTSTDVALVDGAPRLTGEGRIGRYPVAVPMVDMHTIGAGGGSIAWLDAGGMLQVGPESAGADPGPACYGRGGSRPTVTDANLVLGRLQADAFLGGRMRLEVDAATQALAPLAVAMGQSVIEAAQDIVAIANEHMAQALRAISIRRGADPRDHVLMSFGGAGGLHVCALAGALGMRRALVPINGGVLSALGMLAARPGRQLSQTRIMPLAEVSDAELDAGFAVLAEQGRAALRAEGHADIDCETLNSVDLRYRGQSYTLNVAWRGGETTAADFHLAHAQRYGHSLEVPLELVNIRVQVRGPEPRLRLAPLAQEPAATAFARSRLAGVADPVPCYRREELVAGQSIKGPALISEQVATTWVEPGWHLDVDAVGNLLLTRAEAYSG